VQAVGANAVAVAAILDAETGAVVGTNVQAWREGESVSMRNFAKT